MTWLALLTPGSRAIVVTLPHARGLAKRLIAMGLTPGAEVRMVQNRGRGPVIVEVHGVRLALGRGQAAWVAVEPVPLEGAGSPAGLEGKAQEI